MSAVIWKYTLYSSDERISLPRGSRVLHVHEQRGRPCLWALVPSNQPESEERRFVTYGTGQVMDTEPGLDSMYVGTFHLESGALVFHVFEEKL